MKLGNTQLKNKQRKTGRLFGAAQLIYDGRKRRKKIAIISLISARKCIHEPNCGGN
jgi:hypothetical protein